MNYYLLYKPLKLIERVALAISRKRRFKKLKNTVATGLQLGHIDSLELLILIKENIIFTPIIFDIGSNSGTWTLLAKAIFTKAEVHAFEPLEQHNLLFKQNCKRLDNVYLHEYCVGNINTLANINVSSFSDSSSLLSATSLEFEHFNIKKEREEEVEIKRLEELINKNILPIPNVIKIDIQGFELEALKGLGNYLSSVKYIICEVSFKEYYENQPLFLEIANYCSFYGLYLFAFGNNTPINAELNQIDILLKNQTFASSSKVK